MQLKNQTPAKKFLAITLLAFYGCDEK